MKHEHTSELLLYWNQIRRGRTAPERGDIEPADIRNLLKDTFILEVIDAETYSFRLAGTRTCSLFTREVKNKNFLDFFSGENRDVIQTLLHSTCQDASVNLVGLVAKNGHDQTVPLELLALPVALNGQTDQRILGTLSPLTMPYWVGMQPVNNLQISSLRMIMPHELEMASPFQRLPQDEGNIVGKGNIVALHPRASKKVGHLTVFDGGLD